MNIAMLQTVKMPKQDLQPNTVKTANPDAKGFGSVFNSMITKSSAPATKQTEMSETPLAESVAGILEESSLESLLEQLGVEVDESGLFALIGEESTPIAIDDLMTVDNLTEILGITKTELDEIVQKLLGDAKQDITDIWSLIEQAPQILSEVLAVIEKPEQNNVQPKELKQLVQLLKLAQLAGSKVDTVYRQEVQLNSLKDALLALANETQKLAGTEQSTTKTSTFQQVVQQGQTAQTQQTTVKVETDTQTTGHIQQQVTQTKTVTVTLPAEKPAQSDALIKEIQNLVNRSQLSGQPGNMKLFLKLFPENLGQIRIELVQKDGVMTARLLATTAIGKELLENNINQLKAGFVSQNIQMERIDVAQSLQDADRNARDQNFFNNFFRKNDEEERDNNEDTSEEENVSFKDLLSEEVE
ncbi:flagellar hook-length control protein FliK [Solibacillus sp. FSL W7-1324]|uniref:flagellar hook-length control protein FliK n=1 Tax=Solibacillus sp. FSL W7-1324 TaxID=2921701 RepID=UPI0030F8FBE8